MKQRMKDPRQVSQLKVLEHNKGDVNFLSFGITITGMALPPPPPPQISVEGAEGVRRPVSIQVGIDVSD